MGFTTAAAFKIVTSNFKISLALSVPQTLSILQWKYILSNFGSINFMELALG